MNTDNYFVWQRSVHHAYQQLSSVQQVTDLLSQQVRELGFDYYGLVIRHPVPFTRPKTFIYSNTPTAWLDHYHQQKFMDNDPVIALSRRPGSQAVWEDALFEHNPPLWQDARAFGLRAGFSCSVMAANRACGIFSVAKGEEAPLALQNGLPEQLRYLAEQVMATLIRLNDSSMCALNITLTRREREILLWTAEGKTAAEISLILSISEHTVNYHQKNMQKRLNAPNKTQIACYAAAVGLL
nr:transcriptional regulator SdiA [Pantoea sp. 1.19]